MRTHLTELGAVSGRRGVAEPVPGARSSDAGAAAGRPLAPGSPAAGVTFWKSSKKPSEFWI